jgi:twitching motility protein PilJ
MQVLREISSQTAENSAATSNSVGKLAELSAGLRKSVAGFRLPDIASGKTELLTDPARKATAAPVEPPPKAPPPVRAAPKKVSGLNA